MPVPVILVLRPMVQAVARLSLLLTLLLICRQSQSLLSKVLRLGILWLLVQLMVFQVQLALGRLMIAQLAVLVLSVRLLVLQPIMLLVLL